MTFIFVQSTLNPEHQHFAVGVKMQPKINVNSKGQADEESKTSFLHLAPKYIT